MGLEPSGEIAAHARARDHRVGENLTPVSESHPDDTGRPILASGVGKQRFDGHSDPQVDERRAQRRASQHPLVGRAPRRDDLQVVDVATDVIREHGAEIVLHGTGLAQLVQHIGETGAEHPMHPRREAMRVAHLRRTPTVPVERRLHRLRERGVVPLDQRDAHPRTGQRQRSPQTPDAGTSHNHPRQRGLYDTRLSQRLSPPDEVRNRTNTHVSLARVSWATRSTRTCSSRARSARVDPQDRPCSAAGPRHRPGVAAVDTAPCGSCLPARAWVHGRGLGLLSPRRCGDVGSGVPGDRVLRGASSRPGSLGARFGGRSSGVLPGSLLRGAGAGRRREPGALHGRCRRGRGARAGRARWSAGPACLSGVGLGIPRSNERW